MEEILKAEDAGKLLGLSTTAVYRYAREKRIPSFRIGRQFRFSRTALNALIEQQSQQNFQKAA